MTCKGWTLHCKHRKEGGAQMDECVQLYTLNGTLGAGNQGVSSHSINTRYQSARCQRNRTASIQAQLFQLSSKTLRHVSLSSIVEFSGSNFEMKKKKKKKRKKEL